jgi:hypothetical protein
MDSNVCQGCHITYVMYPDGELLLPHEQLALVSAHAASSRYEPMPLIEDDAVTAHAFEGEVEPGRIYSVKNASIPFKLNKSKTWGPTMLLTPTVSLKTWKMLKNVTGRLRSPPLLMLQIRPRKVKKRMFKFASSERL